MNTTFHKTLAVFGCLTCSQTFLYSQNSKEVSELTTLRASWARARQQAQMPIDIKYEASLKALKERFTKSGNLEAAIQVDNELKNLVKGKEEPIAIKPRLDDLLIGKWECQSASGWVGILVFEERGVMRQTDQKGNQQQSGTWAFEGNKLVTKWANGSSDQIMFPPVAGKMDARTAKGYEMKMKKKKSDS